MNLLRCSRRNTLCFAAVTLLVCFAAVIAFHTRSAVVHAQDVMPTVVDPSLSLRRVVAGLNTPTSMAFLGPGDFLVLEKATGKVQRVTGGQVTSTVLDLAVNSASERGFLGIALHPSFPLVPGVYLY